MSEKKLIRSTGFGPHKMPDGRKGFRFQLELLGEGGTALAAYLPIRVSLDGEEFPETAASLSVDGRYFSVREIEEAEQVFWHYGEVGDVFVETGKPLAEGLHTLQVTYRQVMSTVTHARRLTAMPSAREPGKIKRGISFYSYREALANREMDLEGCIAESVKIGANGVELVTIESIPDFPHPTNGFYRKWFALRERYGFVPVSFDSSSPNVKSHFIPPPEEESFALYSRDLQIARYLGFGMIRVGVVTPLPVLERLLPVAERNSVAIAVEIHPPYSMASPWMEERVKAFDKMDSPYIGFIPDMGIFAKCTAPLKLKKMIRDGVNPELLLQVDGMYRAGRSREETMDFLRSNDGGDQELRAAAAIYHNNCDDPELLVTYKRYIKNIHGKFYEMDETGSETSIDYEGAVQALQRSGYAGFICSEYEGEAYYENFDEIEEAEQVRRQHLMLHQLLRQGG